MRTRLSVRSRSRCSHFSGTITDRCGDFQGESPLGKGFADIVYLPLAKCPNRPVVVVELKWNQDTQTAITQIKERAYPESLQDYSGEILLVGIT